MQLIDGGHANANVVQQVLSLSRCRGADPADFLGPDIEIAGMRAPCVRKHNAHISIKNYDFS